MIGESVVALDELLASWLRQYPAEAELALIAKVRTPEMTLFALRSGDVLDAEAQALVVPIDGTAIPRGGQFKQVIVVSTLYHLEHLDFSAKCALVRTSVIAVLEAARRAGIQAIASPVLQGGWRLRPEDAFTAMLSALDTPEDVQLRVYCNDQDLHDRLRVLARSLGRGE